MDDPKESYPWSMGSINLPFEILFPGYYNKSTHIDCQYKFGQMIKEPFQVICFFGAQKKGWNNEMMWAHYADNQRGVCLEFDGEVLVTVENEKFPKTECMLQNVNFTKSSKKKPWINWDVRLTVDENSSNYLPVLSHEVVFHKSHFWEKEDEMRLLFLNHKENLYLPYGTSLKAIHLGLGFPRHYIPAIETLIKDTPIKLYTLIYENDEYNRWRLSRKDGKLWTSNEDY
ncbi:DUF2971 domain-containing protein [Mucilaginibacter terrae]|uniref:DUF2971 domain-containing protein n=1 Tax=Mucilaginibacter terrae TaxID=1955052 RepID=UPI00363E6E72